MKKTAKPARKIKSLPVKRASSRTAKSVRGGGKKIVAGYSPHTPSGPGGTG
jgi:hypothetical protein